MKDRDSYRKEGKQRCRKTPVHTPVHTKTCTRSQRKQSEHVAPVQFPFSYLIGKGADGTFLMNLHETVCLPATLYLSTDMKIVKQKEQD